MPRDISFFTERLLFLGVGVILIASFAACRPAPDIDITSRSTISGIVNSSTVEGKILATFNTGRGGTSTCDFSQLQIISRSVPLLDDRLHRLIKFLRMPGTSARRSWPFTQGIVIGELSNKAV